MERTRSTGPTVLPLAVTPGHERPVAPAAGQPAARGTSELVQRIAFIVVAAPVTVYLVWVGGWPFALLLGAAAGVGAWELFRMARAGGAAPLSAFGIAVAVLIPLYVATEPRGVFEIPPAFAALTLLLVLTVAIWSRGVDGRPLSAVATTLFGVAYTGGLLSFAEGIRYHPYVATDKGGVALLLLPVLLTWANDIGAYIAGRLFGRRKLIPAVSPGKTVAGSVGGLVATFAVCWLYVAYVLRPAAQLSMELRNLIAFAIVVCAAGQMGDLAESLLKREAGVKNSSSVFPGHGGVLDRIDSLLFVLPVAWALFAVPGLLIPTP